MALSEGSLAAREPVNPPRAGTAEAPRCHLPCFCSVRPHPGLLRSRGRALRTQPADEKGQIIWRRGEGRLDEVPENDSSADNSTAGSY